MTEGKALSSALKAPAGQLGGAFQGLREPKEHARKKKPRGQQIDRDAGIEKDWARPTDAERDAVGRVSSVKR